MQKKHAASAYYEDNEEKEPLVNVLKSKVNLEVAIMQICAWMRLTEKHWTQTNGRPESLFRIYQNHALSAPDTGGRLIITASSDTPVQIPHVDYSFSVDDELASDGSCVSLLTSFCCHSMITFRCM